MGCGNRLSGDEIIGVSVKNIKMHIWHQDINDAVSFSRNRDNACISYSHGSLTIRVPCIFIFPHCRSPWKISMCFFFVPNCWQCSASVKSSAGCWPGLETMMFDQRLRRWSKVTSNEPQSYFDGRNMTPISRIGSGVNANPASEAGSWPRCGMS